MKPASLAFLILLILGTGCQKPVGTTETAENALTDSDLPFRWKHFSSAHGDLEPPNTGHQQTASLVCDIDQDSLLDFVIAERTTAPAVVWYRRHERGWTRYVVEDQALPIEAGSAHYDIDGDQDEDIVFGGDAQSNEVWWWENPYPAFNIHIPWTRHTIKNSGETKHHDQVFGDVDGDGEVELVFWNQNARQLLLAEIPEQVRQAESWELHEIYRWEAEEVPQRGKYPDWKSANEHEGLALADMDGNGTMDIVGGGRWFEHRGNLSFNMHVIDERYAFTRILAGQFIAGGRPEVVLVAGDGVAPMMFYEWREGQWTGQVLIDSVYDGHSVSLVDVDQDGNLDIFNAEMGLGNSPHPKARILLGDGAGNFRMTEVLTDYGLHESVMADLDGDGQLDILGKPYNWKTPRLDIWLRSIKAGEER